MCSIGITLNGGQLVLTSGTFEGLHCCEKTQCSERRWCHALSWGSLPTWGGWKMTNQKWAGVSLGLCPPNVKSLLRASRTPPWASTEERASAQKAAAQPCVRVVVAFYSRAPASASLCYWICARRSTSVHSSWNLRAWHRIVYARERSVRVQMCFR